jgi:2-polyprenyl-3-methyl-5-hydroxy-6-metoxy-1,4-benzoquinol methylase
MADTTMAPVWGAARLFEPVESEPEISLETVPCPNCDCRQFHSILEGSDPLTGIGGTFSLVRCAACDLVLTNPRPTPESLGWFYPEDYSPYQTENAHARRWQWLEHLALRSRFGYPPQPAGPLANLLSQLAMWKFHSRAQRHEWIPFRAPGRLLDVGCGAGAFLERMQSFGWTVTGLDYAADVARRVEQRTGIKVHAGTLPHADLAPQSFDAVTMWHVLEHVPHPRQLVEAAAKLLRPGGLLVIEVPNIESRTFAEFREHWFGLELPRHFQHFSPKNLSATLPSDLLRIVEVQQIGMRTWIKRSAQRAVAAGRNQYKDWLTRGKAFWVDQATQSESANQADGLRIIAERRS